jgi:predicted Rdx family selenoprotein
LDLFQGILYCAFLFASILRAGHIARDHLSTGLSAALSAVTLLQPGEQGTVEWAVEGEGVRMRRKQ